MSYSKLRGRIREKFGTQEAFATALNMHPATLSAKLNGKSEWSKTEMAAATKLLDISLKDVAQYFFSL